MPAAPGVVRQWPSVATHGQPRDSMGTTSEMRAPNGVNPQTLHRPGHHGQDDESR